MWPIIQTKIPHSLVVTIPTKFTFKTMQKHIFFTGAVSFVANLMEMNLSHNGLSVLEDLQPYVPSLRKLYLTGGKFFLEYKRLSRLSYIRFKYLVGLVACRVSYFHSSFSHIFSPLPKLN